ncbi:MAG: bidirectional hydrogenase complex protein HoxU [Planctomycetales bacterium]|nr:bidirectional hydrogenase complex protein HoxU [Planctomycetales bacterium]
MSRYAIPRGPVAKVRVVTLKIDGQDIGAREDETILDAAVDNGIHIPTLCYLDGLSAWGACRMCMVEIQGQPKLLCACTTNVAEGMHVVTNSERLQRYRRTILELLFAERNHVCSVCVSNGHCELQDLARECGMDHVRVPYRNAPYAIDSSHDLFRVDHNRCVLCTRCVRVCDEIEGAHTWDVMGRGVECHVITDLNQPWGESDSCTSCGKCVQVCPTGALVKKGTAAGEMEKHDTFLAYLTEMRRNR